MYLTTCIFWRQNLPTFPRNSTFEVPSWVRRWSKEIGDVTQTQPLSNRKIRQYCFESSRVNPVCNIVKMWKEWSNVGLQDAKNASSFVHKTLEIAFSHNSLNSTNDISDTWRHFALTWTCRNILEFIGVCWNPQHKRIAGVSMYKEKFGANVSAP